MAIIRALVLAMAPLIDAQGVAFEKATSFPEVIDAGSIHFEDVSHRDATIKWTAPGLGDWKWPILSYEIQISDNVAFKQKTTATSTDKLEGDTPGGKPVNFYAKEGIWGVCPAGENEASCQGDSGGCTLASLGLCTSGQLHATPRMVNNTVATEYSVTGLRADTLYYVRIRAVNHDGPKGKEHADKGWSEASYGVLTHSKPNKMDAPVVYKTTHNSMTILFDTPTTRGSDSCDETAIKAKVTAGATYLKDQTCNVDGSNATSVEIGSKAPTCATAAKSKPCQSIGSGSEVTNFRVYISEGNGAFTELKSPTTGLTLYDASKPLSHQESLFKATSKTSDTADNVHDWTFTVDALKANTEYSFKVKATNAAGESVESDAGSSTTLGVPKRPMPPVATAVTTTEITLTWNTLVGYCDAVDTVPMPSPTYKRLTTAYPNEGQRTTECPFDNNVALTGYRLFASSYNPGGGGVAEDGRQYDDSMAEITTGVWEPARRGSLSSDAGATAYASKPLDTKLPDELLGDGEKGEWLEINVKDTFSSGTITIDNLAQDTYYKFRILFTNAVGDSPVSLDSKFILTLEEPVANLKMHSSPWCIYENTPEQNGKTRFVATSNGTNVMYKWQLPDGVNTNSHDTRSFGSVIAEGAKNCETDDCSVMTYTLPAIALAEQQDKFKEFTMAVVAYNTRGQTVVETNYQIEYCGCTDPWDEKYWDQATYHVPTMCNYQSWDGADKTVIAGEFEYYQTFYHENTHSAQVIVRVDEGGVDLFMSTEGIPDPAMNHSYSLVESHITSYHAMEIPYSHLAGSRSLYLAVRGSCTDCPASVLDTSEPFSRFAIVATTREFTRGRGSRYAEGAIGKDGSVVRDEDYRRTQLKNIEPQAFEIKTPYYDFFEYYFGKAENDVDVEIKVNCQLGCVNVYTSKIERFPSALRESTDYSGFWTKHNGVVCADKAAPTKHMLASGKQVAGTAGSAQYAAASFDGQGDLKLYGSVTFSQDTNLLGKCSDGRIDVAESSCGSPKTWVKNSEPVLVAVSFKGLIGKHSWEIQKAACPGSESGKFRTMVWDLNHEVTQGSDAIYSATFSTEAASCKSDATCKLISLEGESISSTEEGKGRDGDKHDEGVAQSILGRSVVITQDGKSACATIYPDAQVTSYIGELSLMHTIKPEETVATCLSKDGTIGECDTYSKGERLLFASVQGANPYAVGEEQLNNEYTIEAKIYRYRVDSNLLDVTTHNSINYTEAVGHGAHSGTVHAGTVAEDRRYSIVSIDNFNYYEVECSPAAFGLTVEFTLYYGQVELYTSKYKLPTQDVAGHDNLLGDVHAISNGEKTCQIGGADGHCEMKVNGEWEGGKLAPGSQLDVGKTYRIHIPFSEINPDGKYIFLGILGKAPDSSYEIKVTEYIFDNIEESMSQAAVLEDSKATDASLVAGVYSFFTLYVGPQDQAMYVNKRTHAGHRTGDLGTNPDTWGIDWTEALTSTWVEQQRDEWDLDVEVSLDLAELDGPVTVYGSTREPYPSQERGFDTSITYGCSDTSITNVTAAGKEACDAIDGAVWTPTTAKLVIPHFTFSDKNVYISILPSSTGGGSVKLTPAISEMHVGKLTGNTLTKVSTCRAKDSDTVDCSGQGSCVNEKCYCDNGFLGKLCEIEAFCTGSDCATQPSLAIARNTTCTCAGKGSDCHESHFYCPTGSLTKSFDGDKPVAVPFSVGNAPAGSKVHVYVDGLPYPAKGANLISYAKGGTSAAESVSVYGMKPSVPHVVELLLLSKENIPLATEMIDFTVNYAGGCANNCGGNGVCHHGYCVCFDGFAGTACEKTDVDGKICDLDGKSNCVDASQYDFTPGAGFITYSKSLMQHERNESRYISELKLAANSEALSISDAKIKKGHEAVVDKLNKFVIENEGKMGKLKDAQKDASDKLHRKRDRITTTIQQMREESKRLQTYNTEQYLETVRALHEGQRQMQNDLDIKRRDHFIDMAKRHDEWVEIKERNDFKLNQLRTANGPLVPIAELEERECSQDDMFRTSCKQVGVSKTFETMPGYKSHQTMKTIGTCSKAEEGTTPEHGYSCVCSTRTCEEDSKAIDSCCGANGCTAVEGVFTTDVCVKVVIDGELKDDLYDSIPR
jgi:hypothetical protein